MKNRFFFGVVVGFFIAFVAFVLFLFFSGTVKARAAVQENPQHVAVNALGVVDVTSHVREDALVANDVPQIAVGVSAVQEELLGVGTVSREADVREAVVVRHVASTVVHDIVEDVHV
jgi:hypothetical protein